MAKPMRFRKSLHRILGILRSFLGPTIISAVAVGSVSAFLLQVQILPSVSLSICHIRGSLTRSLAVYLDAYWTETFGSQGMRSCDHYFGRFSTNYSLNFTDLNFASYPNQEPLELFFTSVAGLTGILMTLLCLLWRASYEMFWYTHHLFIVFFLLLFVHGFGGVIKTPSKPGHPLTRM
ncbi:hypothetical protein OS493_018399 [Desmophyllum pertusum]|uniref:Uncharacterized protein n=1 Tax=Desmophyllum pertusum TaxID=174260 RepID=A0A9X0A0R5_9CNID|nr:hypothetical protein OS493_018399 [Desmophyllum pertusum]